MNETLKKVLLTGVGIAALSKEKVEEWAKKFTEEAKLAEDEGKKFVDDIIKQSEEAKKSVEEEVGRLTKSAIDKLGLCTRAELEALKKRIDELEKKLDQTGR